MVVNTLAGFVLVLIVLAVVVLVAGFWLAIGRAIAEGFDREARERESWGSREDRWRPT